MDLDQFIEILAKADSLYKKKRKQATASILGAPNLLLPELLAWALLQDSEIPLAREGTQILPEEIKTAPSPKKSKMEWVSDQLCGPYNRSLKEIAGEFFNGNAEPLFYLIEIAAINTAFLARMLQGNKPIPITKIELRFIYQGGEPDDQWYFVWRTLAKHLLGQTPSAQRGEMQVSAQQTPAQKIETIQDQLMRAVKGQDAVIEKLMEKITIARAGLFTDADKPRGSFLFVGPTGVGKTFLGESLAKALGIPCHVFDMSEYSEDHNIARLIGSPPGYVNQTEGGGLVNKCLKTPEAVFIFDEIEKAHELVWNVLLAVLDKARLTDGKGQTADFSKSYILFTSNVGSREARENMDLRPQQIPGFFEGQARKYFPSEFSGRLSDVIGFRALDDKALCQVLQNELRQMEETLKEKNIAVTFDISDADAEAIIGGLSDDEKHGRGIKGRAAAFVKQELSKAFIDGKLCPGKDYDVQVLYEESGIILKIKAKQNPAEIALVAGRARSLGGREKQ